MSSDDVRLDWQRNDRLGISEAVWGLHKSVDQIVAILEAFAARDQPALVTRVDEAKAQAILKRTGGSNGGGPLHWCQASQSEGCLFNH